ncbi:TIGR04149 family rSAM-modified RiPP [Flavobacterium sp. F52]|uniref:TIGR04149 family rSAM-modified RiPP n=1 Tax=Flavobacterium sp. F52 TaxID=1202532 RepID=UPI0002E5EB21|nr:TIGR04149 family rSAM-modified RiPP [Flavobacterium sp. F52]
MKKSKISLSGVKEKLSRKEMKRVSGGSYPPDHVCTVCYKQMWEWWCDLSYGC